MEIVEKIIVVKYRMAAIEEIAAHREMSCEVIDQMNLVIKELEALQKLVTNE